MSNIKRQIELDYNGKFEDDDGNLASEHFAAFGIEFDLYDDDQYWLTNDSKEKTK